MSRAARMHPLVALLVFLVLFFAAWTLRATLLYAIDLQISSPTLRLLYSNAVKFGVWVVPVLGYLTAIDHVDPLAYLKLTTPLTRTGGRITLLAILGLIVVLLVEGWVRGRDLTRLATLSPMYVVGVLATVVLSPVLEEVLFRGFVLQKLAAWLPFWQANALAGLLFSAAHWPHWLWTQGFGPHIVGPAVTTLVLGCFFGWLVKRTGSLWPAIAAHIVNNVLVALLVDG